MRYYFAYGYNTNKSHMKIRCPAADCIGPAYLENYKLVFRNHADIEHDLSKGMWGVLWSLSKDCEFSLDQFEGFPFYYIKKEVVVKPLNGKPYENIIAMVYKMTRDSQYSLPTESYKQALVDGYTQSNICLSQINNALEGVINNEK
jgi:hypothetical protein